jgi:hypothetical protein
MFLLASMIPRIKKMRCPGGVFIAGFQPARHLSTRRRRWIIRTVFRLSDHCGLSVGTEKTKRSGLSRTCFHEFVEIPKKAFPAITSNSSPAVVFLAVLELCPPNTGSILYGRGKKQGCQEPARSAAETVRQAITFHEADRFGRMSFPDVDTGFIGWAEETVPCRFSRPLNEKKPPETKCECRTFPEAQGAE